MTNDNLNFLEGTQKGKGPAKKKGIVDVVFLLDHSGSMGRCILNLIDNINHFVSSLDPNKVSSWRIRINSFSDLQVDGDKWFVIRDFTDKVDKVKEELNDVLEFVKQQLGGDEDETALDALYKTIESSFDAPFTERTRCVILITDAKTKELSSETVGADIDEESKLESLKTEIIQNHVYVYVYAPNEDERFKKLTDCQKVKYFPINKDGIDPVEALKNLDMKNTLEILGKTVSQDVLI